MDNATSRRAAVIVHAVGVLFALTNTVASTDGIPPTARTNLPLAASFAVMTLF